MRLVLRAILAVALLLGSGLTDWTPVTAQVPAHEAWCCGMAADLDDTCPCPKPENGPQRGGGSRTCGDRTSAVVQAAPRRAEQSKRRVEPRPEPTTWALARQQNNPDQQSGQAPRGREPDLGRHLATLGTFLI